MELKQLSLNHNEGGIVQIYKENLKQHSCENTLYIRSQALSGQP